MNIYFPSSFLWGASISSYQCEGGNVNADWYHWEENNNLRRAARASDHYRQFEEDFRLARESLHLNALRLSIEWSRLYPDGPTVVDKEELDHYRDVFDHLSAHKLAPMVTLHHFTNPAWFARKHGWLDPKNCDFFLRYLCRVAGALKDKVQYWNIFNEPMVYVYNGYVRGLWPPGIKCLKTARKVLDNMISTYREGYQEIQTIYKDGPIKPQISLAKHMRVFSPCSEGDWGQHSLAAVVRDYVFNMRLLKYLKKKNCLDYIALNYYCKEYVKAKGFVGMTCKHRYHRERRNAMGWHTYPRGLYELLMKLRDLELPIFITENGTSETKDEFYDNYLRLHLHWVSKAMGSGVDVRGYFWWSLMDNFEWHRGFEPRFGLLDVDYVTYKRKMKPFAHTYADICRQNKMEV